ncbi:unnamed protein product [Agarophyton chilense]|eukprot:gb/GEZJ01001236.1/.p1 GENE.gb/GEZJ01001236.1/~~gb/GEZJ01001236.1/.p1  ORF type:complete len:207 (-),score=29.75 gb/GEZJ01001236.1/:553-1173(-)
MYSFSLFLTVSVFFGLALAQQCPPQPFPFRSSLLQRQFNLFESCPATPSTARQSFELFRTVLVYKPSYVPSPSVCPERLVFHIRQSPVLPFIVNFPELARENDTDCVAIQMEQKKVFFLNGLSKPDFISSVREMVMVLERMKYGSCPKLGLEMEDMFSTEPTDDEDVSESPQMDLDEEGDMAIFPELEGVIGFFITLAYDQAFCVM